MPKKGKRYNFQSFCYDDLEIPDVCITVGLDQFYLHQEVLSYYSSFFDVVFNSFPDKNEFTMSKSIIKKPEIFYHVVYYIYTGKIRMNVNHMFDLQKVAEKLSMPALVECITTGLSELVAIDNVFDILKKGKKNKTIREACEKFIKTNGIEIIRSTAFRSLDQDFVFALLKDKTFDGVDEFLLFDALVYNFIKRPVKHNWNTSVLDTLELGKCLDEMDNQGVALQKTACYEYTAECRKEIKEKLLSYKELRKKYEKHEEGNKSQTSEDIETLSLKESTNTPSKEESMEDGMDSPSNSEDTQIKISKGTETLSLKQSKNMTSKEESSTNAIDSATTSTDRKPNDKKPKKNKKQAKSVNEQTTHKSVFAKAVSKVGSIMKGMSEKVESIANIGTGRSLEPKKKNPIKIYVEPDTSLQAPSIVKPNPGSEPLKKTLATTSTPEPAKIVVKTKKTENFNRSPLKSINVNTGIRIPSPAKPQPLASNNQKTVESAIMKGMSEKVESKVYVEPDTTLQAPSVVKSNPGSEPLMNTVATISTPEPTRKVDETKKTENFNRSPLKSINGNTPVIRILTRAKPQPLVSNNHKIVESTTKPTNRKNSDLPVDIHFGDEVISDILKDETDQSKSTLKTNVENQSSEVKSKKIIVANTVDINPQTAQPTSENSINLNEKENITHSSLPVVGENPSQQSNRSVKFQSNCPSKEKLRETTNLHSVNNAPLNPAHRTLPVIPADQNTRVNSTQSFKAPIHVRKNRRNRKNNLRYQSAPDQNAHHQNAQHQNFPEQYAQDQNVQHQSAPHQNFPDQNAQHQNVQHQNNTYQPYLPNSYQNILPPNYVPNINEPFLQPITHEIDIRFLFNPQPQRRTYVYHNQPQQHPRFLNGVYVRDVQMFVESIDIEFLTVEGELNDTYNVTVQIRLFYDITFLALHTYYLTVQSNGGSTMFVNNNLNGFVYDIAIFRQPSSGGRIHVGRIELNRNRLDYISNIVDIY